MIQTIDFAPLDGITKIVFRQVWSQFFGGVDRYFIPFFSPTPHHLMTPGPPGGRLYPQRQSPLGASGDDEKRRRFPLGL
ncbi:hypothetical protein [Dysosmobacter sp.]|uniref:hypothetical protein n=1 Tax=Dysosmobacter sp. TaxID=2591382 RepID=UPI003AB1DEF4